MNKNCNYKKNGWFAKIPKNDEKGSYEEKYLKSQEIQN